MTVNYATRKHTIPAGGSLEIPRQANFLTCLEASAPFKVRFDSQPRSDFEAGLTFKSPFQKVEVINSGVDPLTVKLGFGQGDIQDSRLTLSGGIVATLKSPDTMITQAPVEIADGANIRILEKNVNRKEAIIVNEGQGVVYVSTNAANVAGRGIPIAPGQSLTLEQTMAIYGHNSSGAAVTISATDNGWSA